MSFLFDSEKDILNMSKSGLHRRAKFDSAGNDESSFLDPLFKIVNSGNSPADDLIKSFEGPWRGNIDNVFSELIY